MVIIRQNNLQESMLLKISVRICPSFWYQMVLFRVLAHGLLCFGRENAKDHETRRQTPSIGIKHKQVTNICLHCITL